MTGGLATSATTSLLNFVEFSSVKVVPSRCCPAKLKEIRSIRSIRLTVLLLSVVRRTLGPAVFISGVTGMTNDTTVTTPPKRPIKLVGVYR